MTMDFINLSIVEDDPWIAEGLQAFFDGEPLINVLSTTDNMENFLTILPQLSKLDIALIDIGLPGMTGLQGIPAIKKINSEVDIIILSAFEEREKIFEALCEGAVAYLSKRSRLEEIGEAVKIVKEGGSYMSPMIARKVVNYFSIKKPAPKVSMTPRQQEIVEGLVDGLSYKLIATRMNISVETVRDHIKKIYRKLQINSKGELLRKHMDGEL